MPPAPTRLRRWPQEDWAATRKRRPSSTTVEVIAGQLREEIGARESLQDYCYVLTQRVVDLEGKVEELAATIAQIKGETTATALPQGDIGSTVSMHGSSAISRSGTTEISTTTSV